MSKLFFDVKLHSPEVDSLDLPVQVRRPNLTLATESVASKPVDLPAGLYFVTARLPAGQELSNQVTILEGRDATVTLTLEPEDRSPHEWAARQQFLRGTSATALPRVLGSTGPLAGQPIQPPSFEFEVRTRGVKFKGARKPVQARLRIFQGNLLQDQLLELQPAALIVSSQSDQIVKFKAPSNTPALQLVQLVQPNTPPLNLALPGSGYLSGQIVLTRFEDKVSLDTDLDNDAAETLLRYYEKGNLAQTAILTKNSAVLSEDLLQGKVNDPIAACVGAYTLLRLGDLERLHDWTANLYNWFEWLPDGAAIWAEQLARLARHDQALDVLLKLSTRGLPLFSDGLSYALDRLRFYISVGKSRFTLLTLPESKDLLAKLQRYAAFVDFGKPGLTFTGLDPLHPDDEPAGADISAYGGLDLAPYLK